MTITKRLPFENVCGIVVLLLFSLLAGLYIGYCFIFGVETYRQAFTMSVALFFSVVCPSGVIELWKKT